MSDTPIKKQALLIGINQYAILPALKYARQDAEAVADSLKRNYCFSDDEVMLLTDAKPGLFKPINRQVIEKHLEKLAEQDLDLFIFGFWGHGLFRNGQRYFCPLDAISDDIEELGLSFDVLQRLLSNVRAKNTCMILDCCQKIHDRGESETLTAADQTVMENAARDIILKRKEKEPSFQSNAAILNSCKQGQAAYEWDSRQHGIFTAHLLDAMNRRLDSVAQIVSYISKNVEKTAMELGKMQTPLCRLEGDIPLPVNKNAATPVIATPVTSTSPNRARIQTENSAQIQMEVVVSTAPKKRVSKSPKTKKLDGNAILTAWTLLVVGCFALILLVAALSDSGKKSSTPEFSKTEIVEQPPTSEEPVTESQTSEIPALPARNLDHLPKRLPDAGKEAGERAEIAVSGVAIAFRWCPEGEFMMGSSATEPGRYALEKQHKVVITEGFWMMETEVTVGMFKAFVNDTGYESKGDDPSGWMGSGFRKDSKYSWRNPGFSQDDSHPVTCVSWNDAMAFCNWLKDKTGQNFQLPSESQWEYACRAETTTAYAGTFKKMAWYRDNSGDKTHPAGTKKPNAWGLYDMHGNVWEWTLTKNGSERTIRGGSWSSSDEFCRSASSGASPAIDRDSNQGFRCVMLIDKPQEDLETPGELDVPESLLNMSTEWKAPETDQPEDQQPLKQLPETGSEAGERAVVTVNGVEFAFRWCPPGTFMMGSPESEEGRDSDEKLHQVTLTKGFWIMETEVTQKQWIAVMGDNPKKFADNNTPVGDVSWNDCQKFCQKTGFQLPTEAQWEYACRAGTTEAFAGDLDDMAWYEENSDYNRFPVGKKKPNAWGLYDMHGNVMEWCQDIYNYSYPSENVTDPAARSGGSLRVIRGGSYFDNANNCRSASRSYKDPDSQDYHLGFRCVRVW